MNRGARWLGFLAETLIILLSLGFAILTRLGSLEAFLAYEHKLPKALLSVVVIQLTLYYAELYEHRSRRRIELFLIFGQCMAIASVALAVVFFLMPAFRIGRGIFFVFIVLAWFFLLLWRLFLLWAWGTFGAFGDRVLILGTGLPAQKVAREMLTRAPIGYRVLGFLTEHESEVGRTLVNPSVLGTLADLPRLSDSQDVTLIVVAQEDRRKRLPVDMLLRCRMAGVRVVEAASLFESLSGRIPLRDLRPSWLIFSGGFQKPRAMSALKRAGEAAVAALMLVLTLPLAALTALCVRLSSPGPVLYRQTRVGLSGKEFELMKWRTMRADAEKASGPVWATGENDPRVTRLGRFMRKVRLDEVPQLWNVLKGDMSFVGPRPERPHFVQKLRQVIPYYDERHSVRPGITGWAQVKFPYGSTIEDAEEKFEFDLYYVKHMSLLLDIAIVLETVKVMLLGRGR